MTTRYEAAFAFGAEPRTLIFREGCYEALPFEVRLMAPWSGCYYVEADKLRPALRTDITCRGYALVHESASLLEAA